MTALPQWQLAMSIDLRAAPPLSSIAIPPHPFEFQCVHHTLQLQLPQAYIRYILFFCCLVFVAAGRYSTSKIEHCSQKLHGCWWVWVGVVLWMEYIIYRFRRGWQLTSRVDERDST
ncbi:hypothetical protein DFH27DRAFT_544825, partial [Peziza echinospora]